MEKLIGQISLALVMMQLAKVVLQGGTCEPRECLASLISDEKTISIIVACRICLAFKKKIESLKL